ERGAKDRLSRKKGLSRKRKVELGARSRWFQNVLNAANGNDNPVGAIVELVTDFVDSFVEEISFEKNLEIVGILRDKHRTGSGLQITLEKGAAHLAIPNVGPTLEKRNVFCA